MRKAFIETIVNLAENDERIYLLVADIGFGLTKPFSEKYPARFINVGVAEQNMIGVATGLALSGKIVFVYSIANFPTLRCLEQIRNDICYHDVNVNIVAGNTGLAYGALGYTHHAVEDIAVMRALPNMQVIAPSGISEVKMATRAIYESPHPCYLRLGVVDGDVPESPEFQIGKAVTVLAGEKVVLISTGSMLGITMQVADKLSEMDIRSMVVNMPTIKPLDTDVVKRLAKSMKLIVTIEEHSIIGGLGSAVSEVLARMSSCAVLKIMGIKEPCDTYVGGRQTLLERNGLDAGSIAGIVYDSLRMK